MSKEFFAAGIGLNKNCYTVMRHDTDLQVWNGATFEPLTPANWSSYVLSPLLTDAIGDYAGDMPAPSGALLGPLGLIYAVYVRQGASPAITDARAANGTLNWDGTHKVDIISSNAAQLRQNKPFLAFPVIFVSSTDHLTPKTGLTGITAKRSLGGGAFAPCTNNFVEVGSGLYTIDLASTDTNGGSVTFQFSAAGADSVVLTLYPSP